MRMRMPFICHFEQLLERVLRDLARGDHHPERARCIELLLELFERRRRARVDVRVVALDVVPAFGQALRHAGAHAPQADHSKLHQSLTLTMLRPSSRSERKSPSACARIKRPNPNSCPGMGISSPVSSATCTIKPVGGPPLCSCPVECRSRGPSPCVTTHPVSRAREMSGSSSVSRTGSMKAWIAM